MFHLLREAFGLTDKDSGYVYLSDGGHFENLGIYELLRRRCKYIVCVDGEADPDYTFHGLMTLVRHAQLDLGVEIAPDLRDLRPDPETGHSRSHYQLCRVHYPAREPGGERPIGLLLYVKLSVTGNESDICAAVGERLSALPSLRVGNSLVAGEPDDRPLILLAGHLDTVPRQGQGPVTIEDGRLFGLGACDMKGGLAVMIHLLEEENPSPHALAGIFYAGEEGPSTGNELGQVLQEVDWLRSAQSSSATSIDAHVTRPSHA